MRGTLKAGMYEFRDWLMRLFRQPIFLFVTLWGHGAIFLAALVFRAAEAASRPEGLSLFHAYYWALSTATTVGSADIIPVTFTGKVVSILLMVFGSLFLWSYTALFAASFVAPAMNRVGREVREVEREVLEVEREVRLEEATVRRLLAELETYNRRRG